jgi:hypothetical protein
VEQTTAIACTLTAPALAERRTQVLQPLGAAVVEVQERADGYAFRFPADDEWLTRLAEVIALERRCCRFLRFALHCEPAQGPIWLEIDGPPESKPFLRTFFTDTLSRE